jgi:peptidoglycan/LPS O-acetylase OafA/YrhL
MEYTYSTVSEGVKPLPQRAKLIPTGVGKPNFYRPELDVLRFFAFLGVFVFHFNDHPVSFYVQHGIPREAAIAITSFMESGVFGVDLFFVLSAYLITELLLREKDACGFLDVKGFYLRRILRIWPLYFFYIGLALIPVFNPGHAFTWREAIAYLLLAGNWSVVAWGWPMHSIIGPLWTVSIEEQFYLLWPPIVRRLGRGSLFFAAVVMLILSSSTRVAMVAIHGGPNSVWCNTLARLDPIAAGVLLAIVLRGKVPKTNIFLRIGMLIGGGALLCFVANCWKIHKPEQLEWIPTLLGFPVVAAGCTVIVLALLGIEHGMPRPLIYFGKISYGLYVYHALGNELSNSLIPVNRGFIELALRPFAALVVTMALASVSYVLLETPFLKLKKRFTHIESRPI